MTTIDSASIADVAGVALNMRESDFVEFCALLPVDTREGMAALMTSRCTGRDDILAVRLAGRAVGVGSIVEHRPNVATLFFYATDDFPKIALGLTRFILKNLFPRLREAGVHRIECVSHFSHHQAHRWIELLGLRKEAYCMGYGKDGSDFVQFAWVKL